MAAPLRILHSPENVGGNPWGLAQAERKLGLTSDVVVYKDHPFGYPADRVLGVEPNLSGLVKTTKFFVNALGKYDIFHFNFGHSLLDFQPFHYADMRLLSLLRKPMVMTYQGCEGRVGTTCFKYHPNPKEASCTICSNPRLRAWRETRLPIAQRLANHIFVLNPDLLAVIPEAEWMPYASVDPRKITPVNPRRRKELVIVHAPSVRSVKGTDAVLSAVAKLKAKGYPIKLLLVEGKSQKEAWELYAQADIAIDQLIVGWYGAFAVETMALGLPTIAYINEQDLARVKLTQPLPIVSATMATLESQLEKLVANEKKRRDLSRQSREFAEAVHDPLVIARRTKAVYEDLLHNRT